MTDQRDDFDAIDDERGPAPDPRFVRELRAGLIERASQMRSAPAIQASMKPAGRRLDRRIALQLAAVLVLVFAWVGTIAGGGPRDLTDRFGNFLRQDETIAAAPSMYRGNNARTGVIDDSGPAESPYVAWEITPTESGFNIVNATDEIILLAYEQGGRLVALDRTDGSLRWKFDSECSFLDTTPVIVDETVYVAAACQGEYVGTVIALNEIDGQVRWRSILGEEIDSSPLIVDGTLYVMTDGPQSGVLALDTESGEKQWHVMIERVDKPVTPPTHERYIGSVAAFSPSYGDGRLYVTTFDGVVHALDLEAGQVIWSYDTGGNSVSTPSFADGVLYLSYAGITMPDVDGGFLALDAATGTLLWEDALPVHSPYASPVVLDDVVIMSLYDLPAPASTYAWNRQTGERVWELDQGGTTIFADGVLYLLDLDSGDAFALEPMTGAVIWRAFIANFQATPGEALYIRAEPVIQNGALIAATQAQRILIIESNQNPDGSVASPVADSALDFTGLDTCNPPPPLDWASIEGEAEFKLVEVDRQQEGGGSARLHPDDVPTGPAISAELRREFDQLIEELGRCAARGDTTDLSGFVSEDFIRRPPMQVQIEHSFSPMSSIVRHAESISEGADSAEFFELPDGRIAMLIQKSETYGHLFVFTHNGERWVIDEFLEISPYGGLG